MKDSAQLNDDQKKQQIKWELTLQMVIMLKWVTAHIELWTCQHVLSSVWTLCSQRPSPLEYLSYNFCFLCFLAGPACTYNEYQDFITGSNFASGKLENRDQFAQVGEKLCDQWLLMFWTIGQEKWRAVKHGMYSSRDLLSYCWKTKCTGCHVNPN